MATQARAELLIGCAADPNAAPAQAPATPDVKAQADALGVLIRSGVDPAAAAERVGLGGVPFTGAVPVSLRLPEDEADGLEVK